MTSALITNPVDYITLAGQKSPGLADVLGAKREYEWQVRQPPFSSGALIIFKRVKLAEFDVRLRFYDPEDLDAYDTWRKVLEPPKSRGIVSPDAKVKGTRALDIWHPQLEALDIKSVVVKDFSQLEQIDDGVWAVTIRFLEHRGLPKQSLAKVESSKAKPLDEDERRTLALQKELEAVAQELAR